VSPRDEWRHSDFLLGISNRSGGLKSTVEDFPFAAPETDYEGPIEVGMARDDPKWWAEIKGQFYFYIGEPRVYGRCRYELLLSNGYSNSVSGLVLTFWVNPSGSRNLEANQFKYIQRTPDYLLK